MDVITRFAPSPTGFLHIGGARTALFNYLFAKHHGGKFLLRIEDTDRERSTQEAIDAILNGLEWFGTKWDEKEIYQTHREERHKEVAHQLLERGLAYKCYMSPEELQEYREEFKGKPLKSSWRDCKIEELPENQDYVIRLRVPHDGETIVDDLVQGTVVTKNEILEDTIILRSDGTPTYMLAVIVDDHDMGITHIIRGDDHLTNAARQILIYQALNWEVPKFAHIPLIFGPDGKKLSKRHGALGVEAYREMGYLPEALRNYLLRLGWSHGNDEIISDVQALQWFNIESVGKAPARMDFKKLENLNAHYIKHADDKYLIQFIKDKYSDLSEQSLTNLEKGLKPLKERAKTIIELVESCKFLINELDLEYSKEAADILNQDKELLKEFNDILKTAEEWAKEPLMNLAKKFAEEKSLKLGQVAHVLRPALTGMVNSPSVFEIFEILGKQESIKRIDNALSNA